MSFRLCLFVALATFASCTPTLPPCHSTTQYPYAPETFTSEAVALPDDFLTTDNTRTITGLNVSITPQNSRWTQVNVPSELAPVFTALNTLDGWGTTAGISLRFTAALSSPPTGSPASVQTDTLQLWEISNTPHRIPYETQLTDNNETVILWPMYPLRPETLHAVFMLRTEPTAAGDPVCPSSTLQQLLLGTSTTAATKRLVPKYAQALKASGVKAADVGAAVVFTTQSISEQSLAIAQDISSRSYAWQAPPTCTPEASYNLCSASFQANDYQNSDDVVTGTTPQSTYVLNARIWAPLTAPKPWPIMIFGHGLGGDSAQGDPLGVALAPLGIAVIGIDAVDHGSHPGAPSGQLPEILAFFGLNTGNLEPLVLRDNFRQSTYDKLQLLQVLLQDGDLDGDGKPDLDLTKISYYGVSLGGIMGPEFLSVQDKLGLSVLSVPGGRVSSIVEYAPQFAFLPQIFLGENNTQGDIDRFFPIMQAAIEAGDSANYGPHVLANRFPSAAARAPHVMFNEVLNDDTVGNVSNHALARAMNIPELPPVLTDVGLIPVLTGDSVSGDLDNGVLTAALFEYDRITETPGGPVQPATHVNVSASVEALYQTTEFLETWVDAGTPTIVDPYVPLHTPPLPDAGSDAGE
jgi:hypothetical protein